MLIVGVSGGGRRSYNWDNDDTFFHKKSIKNKIDL